MYQLTITAEHNADVLYHALKPEEVTTDRAQTSIDRQGDSVCVTIRARDATALKALTQSMIKLIETAEKIQNGKRN